MHVILQKTYGQLGNRLFTFSNLLAIALERNWIVYNLSFRPYAGDFHHFRGHNVPHWPLRNSSLFYRLVRKKFVLSSLEMLLQKRIVLDMINKLGMLYEADDLCELTENDLQEAFQLKSNKWLLWTAWNLHFEKSRLLHRKKLVEIFRPTNNNNNWIEDQFRHLDHDLFLVGVHMRRGDYKDYLGGIYYFSHSEYRSLLKRLCDLLGMSRIYFIVVSNEPVPISLLEGLPATCLNGSEVQDLYSLARCNLIVGPPSSFSDWAAFYGDTKRYIFTGELPTCI